MMSDFGLVMSNILISNAPVVECQGCVLTTLYCSRSISTLARGVVKAPVTFVAENATIDAAFV